MTDYFKTIYISDTKIINLFLINDDKIYIDQLKQLLGKSFRHNILRGKTKKGDIVRSYSIFYGKDENKKLNETFYTIIDKDLWDIYFEDEVVGPCIICKIKNKKEFEDMECDTNPKNIKKIFTNL